MYPYTGTSSPTLGRARVGSISPVGTARLGRGGCRGLRDRSVGSNGERTAGSGTLRPGTERVGVDGSVVAVAAGAGAVLAVAVAEWRQSRSRVRVPVARE